MMRIILREDVPGLGVVGDMVAVKDGYGRNYLIPQGKAVFASVRSVSELEHQKRLAAHNRETKTAEAQLQKKNIEALSIVIGAKTAPIPLDENGDPRPDILSKLFGSVTSRDLTKVLNDAAGLKLDHRRVTLPEPVRALGKYEATVRLDGGTRVQLPFWVIPEGAEDPEAEKKRVVEAQAAAAQAEIDAAAASAAAIAASAELAAKEQEARDEEEEHGNYADDDDDHSDD